MIEIGLERVLSGEIEIPAKARIGYLANHASTDGSLIHGRIRLKQKFGDRFTCIFSPQHGFYSDKQDNMIESDHMVDDVTGLPVYSLYGEKRKPTEAMFSELDILLVDLCDVGTRVYTFCYSMAYCMEVAAQTGKKIMILDRPNPIGGENIEGNILEPEYSSFVGLYPIPMRHGLTMGELALFFNEVGKIGADLTVVTMKGWERWMDMDATGFPWIAPSPNMPTPTTALVYPGQVIWEGTTDSEGRGTTQPFEFVGGPYWDHKAIQEELLKIDLPGCLLRPIRFEPTSGKHAGRLCTGFQIHVLDPKIFMPYRTSLALLQSVMNLNRDSFAYKAPPYEYEYERLPMDLILGSRKIREQLEAGIPVTEMERGWEAELRNYENLRQNYFLY